MSLTATKPLEDRVGRVPFAVDVPFVRRPAERADTKGVAKGDLVLEGYFSTVSLDRDFEVILPNAYEESLRTFLQKNPILLWQHNPDWPLGQVLQGEGDPTGLKGSAYVRRPVPGEEPWKLSAYNDIKAGIVKTFSVGGFFSRELVEDQIVITSVDLFEISVVSIPSNPDSLFDAAVKAARGERAFGTQTSRLVAQMRQLLGMDEVTDKQLVALDDTQRMQRYHELAAQFASLKQVEPPGYGEYRAVEQGFASEELTGAEARGRLIVLTRKLAAATRDEKQVGDEATDQEVMTALEGVAAAFESGEAALDNVGIGDSDEPDDDVNPEAPDREDLDQAVEIVGAAVELAEEHLEAIGWVDPDAADDASDRAVRRRGRKGMFLDEMAEMDLADDLMGGFCALRGAIMESLGGDDGWMYDIELESITPAAVRQVSATVDEFRDWLVDTLNNAGSEPAERAALMRDLKTIGVALEKAVLSTPSLGFAPRDRAWDASAAQQRMQSAAANDDGELNPTEFAKGFLYRDESQDATNVGAYKFPVCDVISGELKYVPKGIFAAAGRVDSSSLSDGDKAKLRTAIGRLYSRMRSEFDDDSITPPWED